VFNKGFIGKFLKQHQDSGNITMKNLKEVTFLIGKRVWILNHYALTPDLAGGTRHFDLGKELVKRGYEIVIFASGFDHASKKHIKVDPKESFKEEKLEGVCFVWLKTLGYKSNNWRRITNMFSYGFRIISASRKFNKPDIIIGSSVHPIAVFAGWWLAKRYKARFIFEVRDIWPQTLIDMGAMKATDISARLLYAWEKFMCKQAEKIIVLMPMAKQYYINKGIDAGKIYWIPNGVDLERYQNHVALEPSTEIGQIIEQYREKFKVVYTGAHGQANGLDVAIDAAAVLVSKAPDIHFILIGDGPSKQLLKEKAESLGCTNVTFCEPVPKASIQLILEFADVLLHCLKPIEVLKYGGSSNKLNDYLASGRPIVMSADIVNDIITEAQAGLTVIPGDPEALAEGILKIFHMSKEERERLGVNGREYVEKHHNISTLGEALARLL